MGKPSPRRAGLAGLLSGTRSFYPMLTIPLGLIRRSWRLPAKSIPDYLALVGDSADGFPGMRGWGKKAAASILSVYTHLEDIPRDWNEWRPSIRNASLLANVLFGGWEQALLFRTLATLRTDVPVFNTVDDLRWRGAQLRDPARL